MTQVSSRTRLGLDERRAQLIELGRTLFNARSYDEISIDDIAAAAGVSKGLLYHYFRSKRSFYVETVRAGAEQMTTLTGAAESFPPGERLERGLDAYLDYVEANAAAYATLLRSGIGADAEVGAIVEDTRRVLIARITRGLGVESPPAPLRVALRAWIGFVEGASLEWIDHGGVSKPDLRRLLVAALQASVASASSLRESELPPLRARKRPPSTARRPAAKGKR